eukprot:CAMPEP_0114112370 /NCGR_PEP_ID=MMETSP0043_2-20121206/2352_1 /TAXON_ID=464988 /ORGANISM="Hemiselmis andersenii, Strain CCMP644" /LENGTH=329 /DNA_ID=CAMNT_0001204467 /DNA_START=809 /DNA_END=1797 /DNA_ORIENTATION=+
MSEADAMSVASSLDVCSLRDVCCGTDDALRLLLCWTLLVVAQVDHQAEREPELVDRLAEPQRSRARAPFPLCRQQDIECDAALLPLHRPPLHKVCLVNVVISTALHFEVWTTVPLAVLLGLKASAWFTASPSAVVPGPYTTLRYGTTMAAQRPPPGPPSAAAARSPQTSRAPYKHQTPKESSLEQDELDLSGAEEQAGVADHLHGGVVVLCTQPDQIRVCFRPEREDVCPGEGVSHLDHGDIHTNKRALHRSAEPNRTSTAHEHLLGAVCVACGGQPVDPSAEEAEDLLVLEGEGGAEALLQSPKPFEHVIGMTGAGRLAQPFEGFHRR